MFALTCLKPPVTLVAVLSVLALLWDAGDARAAIEDPERLVRAVVEIRSEVPATARTSRSLGREREGTGVVIDDSGLVLTIGYVVLEASAVDIYDAEGERHPAEIVAYDHKSGLGLVRALDDLEVEPVRLGRAREVGFDDPLLAVARIGKLDGLQVRLADRRTFAGYWEYLLNDALFTVPAFRPFGGAALLDRDGRLVGVGSLFVGDAAGEDLSSPGNMFVPVEELMPVLAELLGNGRREAPPEPWMGIYAFETPAGVRLRRVAEDGPAQAAGLLPGDTIMAIGSTRVEDLESLYRALWDQGDAGVEVPVRARRGSETLELTVRTMDRYDWLRFDHTY